MLFACLPFCDEAKVSLNHKTIKALRLLQAFEGSPQWGLLLWLCGDSHLHVAILN